MDGDEEGVSSGGVNMRCMHCGKELQDTKCAGCGFDYAGGEYMTVFPLNAAEEKAHREAIASHEARIQTELEEARRQEAADAARRRTELEAEEARRREAADVAKRRQKRNKKVQWWRYVLYWPRYFFESVPSSEKNRRMQVACGISLLLSIGFLVFVGFTCNVSCDIEYGCTSYYDVQGWIYLLFAGVVSIYNVYMIVLERNMSLCTRDAYFAYLVCYMIAGAVELLVILPHITDWLRVSFLLLLVSCCCVVVSISYWLSEWLGGVSCCLITLLCIAGVLFWPNIISKPINDVARPLFGNLFCETYYSDDLFGIYLTSGKVKHVDTYGGVYEGDCVNGIRTGKGTYIDESGDVYEGEFVNGEQTGFGKKTYRIGAVYEGEFVDGRCLNGTFTDEIGEVYEVYEGDIQFK